MTRRLHGLSDLFRVARILNQRLWRRLKAKHHLTLSVVVLVNFLLGRHRSALRDLESCTLERVRDGLVFDLTRLTLYQLAFSGPRSRHDAVVVRGLVTTQTERYNSLLARRLPLGRLMERLHGPIVVLVDFDRPIIDLAHGLDLDVVAPRSIE